MSRLNIIFEFVGGPNDGVSLHGKRGDGGDADRYYLLTNRGTVGQRFKVASEYAVDTLAREQLKDEKRHHFQQHYYVVTDCLLEHEEVLVRAEYVEHKKQPGHEALIRQHLEPSIGDKRPSPARRQQFLRQTARSLAQSYSHYWPADGTAATGPGVRNLSLHLAHVLLSENFSVFAKANHPDATKEPIDLLGIAPSQDSFLACGFVQLDDVRTVPEWLRIVRDLESFWLHAGLTIPACSQHIGPLAKHCQAGYGMLIGGHWVSAARGETNLIDVWSRHAEREGVIPDFARRLTSLDAEWYDPVAVQTYEDRGTYYLLGVGFCIAPPRDCV